MIIHNVRDQAFRFERGKGTYEGESDLRLCHSNKN